MKALLSNLSVECLKDHSTTKETQIRPMNLQGTSPGDKPKIRANLIHRFLKFQCIPRESNNILSILEEG